MDEEDGTFAGRSGDGPMNWSSVNENGNVTNICTPINLGALLPTSGAEQICRSFTSRYYLSTEPGSTNEHVITLEVIDSDGNRATDSIVIRLEFDLI